MAGEGSTEPSIYNLPGSPFPTREPLYRLLFLEYLEYLEYLENSRFIIYYF